MKEALKDVIDGIIALADKERKESEPYKNLFKKMNGVSLPVSLEAVTDEMTSAALNASAAFRNQGIKLNNEAWRFLLALPITAHLLEKHIKETEGSACCVDKTWHLLGRQFQELIAASRLPTHEN